MFNGQSAQKLLVLSEAELPVNKHTNKQTNKQKIAPNNTFSHCGNNRRTDKQRTTTHNVVTHAAQLAFRASSSFKQKFKCE
jgi:hypothetical protein